MPRTTVRQTKRFDSRLEKLARKYPQVLDALDELVVELEEGNRPGARYRRVGDVVYRVRLVNRSARAGKRGGFRIAYHVGDGSTVTLIAICARQDCRELDETRIRQFVSEL